MSLFLTRGPIGICDRCHTKKYLRDLKPDGDSPGLRVCSGCWDSKDRYKLPPRQTEDISLRFIRPDERLE
jgi:hypothetical protein